MAKDKKTWHDIPRSDEQHAKHRKLFHDKRVHSIVDCPTCGSPISLSEAKRNGGLCDACMALKS